MNIYIIDDHALFRNGLVSLLESQGIEATACASAQEGLEEIPTLELDIILLDLRMPQMSGLEVLQALKARGVKTPIVMLQETARRRCFAVPFEWKLPCTKMTMNHPIQKRQQ